jgi:hypothetical protein
MMASNVYLIGEGETSLLWVAVLLEMRSALKRRTGDER